MGEFNLACVHQRDRRAGLPNIVPYEMKSWWNREAKEVKSSPRAATSPPRTAVRRVDFLRQMAMVRGERSHDSAIERAPSQPDGNTAQHRLDGDGERREEPRRRHGEGAEPT